MEARTGSSGSGSSGSGSGGSWSGGSGSAGRRLERDLAGRVRVMLRF